MSSLSISSECSSELQLDWGNAEREEHEMATFFSAPNSVLESLWLLIEHEFYNFIYPEGPQTKDYEIRKKNLENVRGALKNVTNITLTMSSGAPYVTPIYSEESLEASTEQNLLTAFKELPNDLVALVAKRYPQGLPFVIIDGTLMRNTWGADGLFDEEQNVIFLKKEGFTKSNDAVARQRTVNVIAHELGHALLRGPEITTWTSRVINLYSKFSKGLSTFGPGDSRYFIADLLKQTRDAVYKEHQHRYVSAYSLLDADEFFADNSAAFFNTNTTESKCDYDLSSRSRENLRAIQPEMYLSMRLFYENTSPIFGYDDVFEKESYPILSRLVEEIPADQENRPITELYDRYRTLRWPTS